jgi:sulfite oxidase
VPGVVGARSVKWLNKIVLSNEESKSHWQQNDYKVLPNSLKNLKDADFSKYKAVQESPIQSAICKPVNNAVIEKEDEYIKIKGYAFSGGGKDIDSVIVSIDDGLTWQTADLNQFSRPLNRFQLLLFCLI